MYSRVKMKAGCRQPRTMDAQWGLFFIEILNFWAWADNLGRHILGHLGYFRPIGTVSPLFTINPSLFLQKTKPLYPKGPFTNYVYKRRGVGGQKKSTFCKLLYHRKCKWRGVGEQKKPNFVNVVCEHPLTKIMN